MTPNATVVGMSTGTHHLKSTETESLKKNMALKAQVLPTLSPIIDLKVVRALALLCSYLVRK